jgi:transposase-like protein
MNDLNLETSGISKQGVECPKCRNDVAYRYGHTGSGKQKYLCVMCGYQFVIDKGRCVLPDRPTCPKCGRPMHVYMQGQEFIRFRCSAYPQCREFLKIAKEN